jgi:putative NADH-flavin reductase
MKVTVFGATGDLGQECVEQALEAGHEVTVLARSPGKLSARVRERIEVIEGNALDEKSVVASLETGCEAILFAIGVDKQSQEDLCTDITRHILAAMPRLGVRRLVWCGGGSNLMPEDQVTFGAKFVEGFASLFLGLRHRDKIHQLELLNRNLDLDWIGIRPLQMAKGPRRESYQLGYDRFSGFSRITFADCAHAMVGMLEDDTWIHKAPIVQY